MFKATMHKSMNAVGDLANLTSDSISYLAGYVEHARDVQKATAKSRLGAAIAEEEHELLQRLKDIDIKGQENKESLDALRQLADDRMKDVDKK